MDKQLIEIKERLALLLTNMSLMGIKSHLDQATTANEIFLICRIAEGEASRCAPHLYEQVSKLTLRTVKRTDYTLG